MLYGLLNTRNPDPEHSLDLLQELQDLYEGGYSILRRAKKYLPKCAGEKEAAYDERVELTSYISYLGQIIDSYVANLFAQDIAVAPAADASDPNSPGKLPDDDFYPEFEQNADLKGTPFANMLRDAFTRALVKRRALIGVDFPVVGEVKSRADEESQGAGRGYLYEVTLEELYDWHYDEIVRTRVAISEEVSVEFEVGRFAWAILKRTISDRTTPGAKRGLVVEEFKVWDRDDEGRVIWQKYRTLPFDPKTPPKDEDDLKLFASGTTSFKDIPLVEVRIPYGLWVGTKVGPLNKEHWRRRSSLLGAEQQSMAEVAVAYLTGSVPAPNDGEINEIAENVHRADKVPRNEVLKLAEKDRFEFAGPSGKAFSIVDAQLDKLVDEMFRTAHQMAASISNTNQALGRSGTSKQEDRHTTTVVLVGYGAIMRDFARRIFKVLSDARNEDVRWQTRGLDHYEMYDRAEVLSEAVQVDLIAIPSRTWRVAYKTQTAMRLLSGQPPSTQATIAKEIDENTTAEEVLAAFTAGVGVGDDGKKPPALKAPPAGAEDESEIEEPA